MIELAKAENWYKLMEAEETIRSWWNEHRNDKDVVERVNGTDFRYQRQQDAIKNWLNNNPISEDSLRVLSNIPNPAKHSDSDADEICVQAGLPDDSKNFLMNVVDVLQQDSAIRLDNYGRKVPLFFSLALYKLKGSLGEATQRLFEYYLDPITRLPASTQKMDAASDMLQCDASDQELIDSIKNFNLDGAQCVNPNNQNHLYWHILWYALRLGDRVDEKIPSEGRRYWLAGTNFSGGDQLDNLVKGKYWEGGNVKKSHIMNAIRSVRTGDVIIAKSTSKKGPEHSISFIRIKAVGLVTSDMKSTGGDWYSCGVDWIKFPEIKDYEGAPYGKYLGTMHLCMEDGIKKFANEILKLSENTEMDTVNQYVELLKANHNIILHGAPGTGKTYLAKQIAKEMGCTENEIGFVQFHQSYDYTDFVEGLRPAKGKDGKADGFERKDGVFKGFCKKAIDGKLRIDFDSVYAQFIQDIQKDGLDLLTPVHKKPFKVSVNSNNNLYAVPNTETKSQMPITKELLQTAIETGKIKDWKPYVIAIEAYLKEEYNLGEVKTEGASQKKNFVFIIDEINRGEMTKIFGELFFSIDPGYRGEAGRIKTQYQNLVPEGDAFEKGFFVPENVYIIGTMNDIDRSVESMDFAMRRRFAFKEVKASDRTAMLDGLTCGKKTEAVERMNALNAAIEKVEGLSSAYDIGPAYFLKLDNYGGDFNQLWEYHIEGVLREYLRGMEDADGEMKKLAAAYGYTDSNKNEN